MHNRQIDMLRTVIPYTAPDVRKPIQILLQVQELSEYIQGNKDPELEACDLDNVGDIEGMMESLRQYCTVKEKDTVDLVLNYVRAQRMYQTYRGYAASTGKQKNDSYSDNGNNMMEFLMSQLSPEQQKMFAQMSTMMNAD